MGRFAIIAVVLLCLPAAKCDGVDVPDAKVTLFCDLAKPITWSLRDTTETRRQVKIHNATWKSQNCRAVIQ